MHGDYPYTCNHDTLRENDNDNEIPKQYGCCLYNPDSCRRVHESFIRASVFFDVARTDEIKREGAAASKETAPPPVKKARVQEAKKGAKAPIAGRYKNNKK